MTGNWTKALVEVSNLFSWLISLKKLEAFPACLVSCSYIPQEYHNNTTILCADRELPSNEEVYSKNHQAASELFNAEQCSELLDFAAALCGSVGMESGWVITP